MSNQFIDELTCQLKQKKIAALEHVYDLYAAALFGYIMRHGCSSKEGGEILVRIFLKAWEQIQSFDPTKQRLFTWLFHLTRDELLQRYGKIVHPLDERKAYL